MSSGVPSSLSLLVPLASTETDRFDAPPGGPAQLEGARRGGGRPRADRLPQALLPRAQGAAGAVPLLREGAPDHGRRRLLSGKEPPIQRCPLSSSKSTLHLYPSSTHLCLAC